MVIIKDKVMRIGFHFYILDLFIFGVVAGIIAFLFSTIIFYLSGENRVVKDVTSDISFFLILVVLMYWNYKYRYRDELKKKSVLEELQTRFVKGEITKKQYDQMEKNLET